MLINQCCVYNTGSLMVVHAAFSTVVHSTVFSDLHTLSVTVLQTSSSTKSHLKYSRRN